MALVQPRPRIAMISTSAAMAPHARSPSSIRSAFAQRQRLRRRVRAPSAKPAGGSQQPAQPIRQRPRQRDTAPPPRQRGQQDRLGGEVGATPKRSAPRPAISATMKRGRSPLSTAPAGRSAGRAPATAIRCAGTNADAAGRRRSRGRRTAADARTRAARSARVRPTSTRAAASCQPAQKHQPGDGDGAAGCPHRDPARPASAPAGRRRCRRDAASRWR